MCFVAGAVPPSANSSYFFRLLFKLASWVSSDVAPLPFLTLRLATYH